MIVEVAIVALCVVGVVAALVGVYFVGLRRKSQTVRRWMRAFTRRVVNPRMMTTAGTPGAYAAVIEHVGRRTGTAYRTPVVAAPTDDGFVIALPYGTTSNWVKNVLASGSAVLTREGVTHRVDGARVVPLAEVADRFPAKERRSHERFRVDRCLRLRSVEVTRPR